MCRKTYDMTDLEVFASDCQELVAKIEAAIASGRKKPVTGTWKQIETRARWEGRPQAESASAGEIQ